MTSSASYGMARRFPTIGFYLSRLAALVIMILIKPQGFSVRSAMALKGILKGGRKSRRPS